MKTTAQPPPLSDSEICSAEVRRHDPERWLSALFAPEARRQGLFALYAFNLELSQVAARVREAIMGEIRLAWWRESLAAIFAGSAPAHPAARELGETIARYGLAQADLERLIDARASGFTQGALADPAAALEQARHSSANLMQLAVRILIAATPEAHLAAEHAGIACGLVEALKTASGPSRRDVMVLAALAQEHLALARAAGAPKESLPALLPASLAALYLARLQRRDFNLDRMREVSLPRKQMTLLGHALVGRI